MKSFTLPDGSLVPPVSQPRTPTFTLGARHPPPHEPLTPSGGSAGKTARPHHRDGEWGGPHEPGSGLRAAPFPANDSAVLPGGRAPSVSAWPRPPQLAHPNPVLSPSRLNSLAALTGKTQHQQTLVLQKKQTMTLPCPNGLSFRGSFGDQAI